MELSPDFSNLSRLSGYRFAPDLLALAQEAAQTGVFADGNTLIEAKILQTVQAAASQAEADAGTKAASFIRKAVRQAIKKLFGERDGEEEKKYKGEKLRPAQQRYIDRFFSTKEDIGLGFSMGGGKTRAFLEIVSRFLRENSVQFVVISTPQTNLVTQIKQATQDFSSLAHLQALIADNNEEMAQSELRERIAIQNEQMDDAAYEKLLADNLAKPSRRIIVATPEKIDSMLQNGQLDASQVGLLILDEGGIGSKEQTGEYPNFKIVKYLRHTKTHFRTILADATPTQLDYLEEKFGIKNWDFGEYPLFATVLHDSMHTVEETPEHDLMRARFKPLLRSRYSDFRTHFLSPDFQLQLIRHKIKNEVAVPALRNDEEWPHIKITDLDDLKKCISEEIEASGKNEESSIRAKRASLLLSAYSLIQSLGETLENKTYHGTAEKISEHKAEFTDKAKIRPRLRRLFGASPSSRSLENTSLDRFGQMLRAEIEAGKENPKVGEMRKLLEEIRREGKKTLVLCEHLGTADWLNFLAETKWGMRCAVVHGSDKTKKNDQRQQFVFEQFRRGEIDVVFATSVANRGLDIPEIDYVISYSPCGNAETQLQSKGRMRKGGTMITLCLPREQYKAYKNKRKAQEFWREKRKRAVVDADQQPPDPKQVLLSRFSGKLKTSFFAGEMSGLKKLPLNRAVNERFILESIAEPELDASLKSYVLRLRLRDKTGSITYYYNFSTREEALAAKNSLQIGAPVVALGIMERSAQSGNIYLRGDHNPYIFQEGVISCPYEDADWDNLGQSREQAPSQVSLPVFTPPSAPPSHSALSSKKEQKGGEQLELRL